MLEKHKKEIVKTLDNFHFKALQWFDGLDIYNIWKIFHKINTKQLSPKGSTSYLSLRGLSKTCCSSWSITSKKNWNPFSYLVSAGVLIESTPSTGTLKMLSSRCRRMRKYILTSKLLITSWQSRKNRHLISRTLLQAIKTNPWSLKYWCIGALGLGKKNQ